MVVLADVAAAPVLTFIRSAAVRKKLDAGQTTNELSGISKLVAKDNKVSPKKKRQKKEPRATLKMMMMVAMSSDD